MELSESQYKCLLAIDEKTEIGSADGLAKATGLDRQEAEDVMLLLSDMNLIELAHDSMWLNHRGREAVRQLRAVLEKSQNDEQLKR